MMKFSTSVLFASGLALSLGTGAQADLFTGGGDGTSWEDPANWALGAVPLNNGSGNTFINAHDVVFDADTWTALQTAGNVQSATQYRVVRFLLNESTSGPIGTGSITFDHGDGNTVLQTNSTSAVLGSRTGTSTVNVVSGSVNTGSTTTLGARTGTGILNLTGGEFIVGRGNLTLGNGADGTGVINASGGSLLTRGGATVGELSTFNVVGAGSTIGIGSQGSVDGFWQQNAGGTLSAAVDSVAGLTTVFVDDLGGGATATFDAGSVLDLSFVGTSASGTWTLLELEGAAIVDNGLILSSATAAFDGTSGWTFDVDNSGANGLLTATFTAVPEPASLALLGAGGLLALGRRRK